MCLRADDTRHQRRSGGGRGKRQTWYSDGTYLGKDNWLYLCLNGYQPLGRLPGLPLDCCFKQGMNEHGIIIADSDTK